MSAKNELTAEIVRELLDYDPATGFLTWKRRQRKWFSCERDWKKWNTRYVGKRTFTSESNTGYSYAGVFNRHHFAHRIAWLHVYGRWPVDEIDHINGIRTDNRLCNLREASCGENKRNARLRKDNPAGLKGVSWHSRRKKWYSRIRVLGRTIHLGEAAFCAYTMAAEKHFGEFSRFS